MACFSAGSPAFINDVSSSSITTGSRRSMPGGMAPVKPVVVLSSERRDSYGSLVLQAAQLLGPPTRFEASKLKVLFMGDELEKPPMFTLPRTYTLTHCDFTANLTLAVSNCSYIDKLRVWQTTLHRDDVVAEWKNVKGEMSLHVHCYVSGDSFLQQLVAEFRYHIFSKELPLVLKAVIHGDSVLFDEHPELLDAVVWVYFHSKSDRYNHAECWGPLKDATKVRKTSMPLFHQQRTYDNRAADLQNKPLLDGIRNLASPGTVFRALVAFLL